MLGYVAIFHVYFSIFFSFFIQSKERPSRTKLFPAKRIAVLVTFGSLENVIVYSAQY